MDLANLSFKPDRHALPLFRQTMNIDTSYYPERLGAFFIVNAPWIFRSLWALVRPWLDPRTQAKFHICGADFGATLRQYIDADMLPVEYGGTNPTNVRAGPPRALPCHLICVCVCACVCYVCVCVLHTLVAQRPHSSRR
jgi:hypothetical protein